MSQDLARPKICIACARSLPFTQYRFAMYAHKTPICSHCEALAPLDLVTLAQETLRSKLVARYTTRAGRQEQKMEALLATYADTGKRCTSCHEHKPADAYDMNMRQADRLQPDCRDCKKLYKSLRSQPNGLAHWHMVRQALRDKAAAKDKPV